MSPESTNDLLSMSNVYNVLREACGLSQAEAADLHEARLDSVKSWCSDRRTAPPGVINDLQKLARQIHTSGVRYAELLKQRNEGDVYIIGLARDEDDARACGFPSMGAQMRAVAVAISQLSDDSEIRLIERVRGAYPAPVLDPEPVAPTEADRRLFASMKFTSDRFCSSGNVNRSKYERLEEIGWIVGTATNMSDVEYRLTATGKTQLARMRS
jgi:hypothetical protein